MRTTPLYRLGRFAARRPWLVLGSWVAAAVVVVVASAGFGQELDDSFGAPGLDSQDATNLMERAGSTQSGLTAQVVVTPRDEAASFHDSPEARSALATVQARVSALPNVLGISDPAGAAAGGPAQVQPAGVLSPDGRVAVVRVQYPAPEDLGTDDLERLKQVAAEVPADSPVRVELGGDLFFAFESAETGTGELIGLGVAVVVLLVAFGSVVAMGLPIGMALFGLALGTSALSLVTYLVDVPTWAPVVGSMVGLGVGIDYALFVVTRHRDYLADGWSVEESVGRALATAGRSVAFAGGTVVVAILGLAVAGVPFMTAGGIAISLIVLIMVISSLTLLPALLGLAGHRVNGWRRSRRARPHGAGWLRWGRHVSRHAPAYALGATALLLGLTAPVLALRVGTPDEGSLPTQRTERRAYDLVAEGFGPGINGPLVVAVDTSQDAGVVEPLREALDADPGIASVGPAQLGRGLATMVAFPTTGPQNDATRATVDRLREVVLPTVLGDSPAVAHIGGQTATFADVGGKVNSRLPLFVGAVIGVSMLLLMLVFRSILVPLKAAALNLLSIGASFGVLVMVFQWGWGADLIGLETTIPVLPFIPMFMFAILFGLSMDYEVFLLSRVKEEYELTGDNERSVIHGIATTGRVVTSAALIMISVFLGFVLGEDPTAKMLGLGLATAVLVDATLVRMVLLPATMKLLGDANWWLPGWLDRLLPRWGTSPAPSSLDLGSEHSGDADREGQDDPDRRAGDDLAPLIAGDVAPHEQR